MQFNLSISVPFNPNLRHSLSHIQTSKSVPPIISRFRMSIRLNVYLPQKTINSKAHRWAQASKAATTVRPMSTWSSRMKIQMVPSTTKRFLRVQFRMIMMVSAVKPQAVMEMGTLKTWIHWAHSTRAKSQQVTLFKNSSFSTFELRKT